MDEWKRFANAAVQEELIAQAEALGKKYDLEKPEDMEKAARELHDIQERWKTAAEAPRAQAQTLWHRYRQAADPIQAKAREFFARPRRRARGQPQGEARALRARRGARRLDRLDQDRRGDEEAPGGVAGLRSRPAPRHPRRVEAVPRRVRQVLHAPQRRPGAAQGSLVDEPGAGRKRCAPAPRSSPTSRDWDKAASELRRLQADWKNDRPGPPHQVRSAVAAVPDGRGYASSTATSAATRSRSSRARPTARRSRRARGVPPGRGGRAVAPPDLLEKVRSLRTRWNQSTTAVRSGRRSAQRRASSARWSAC